MGRSATPKAPKQSLGQRMREALNSMEGQYLLLEPASFDDAIVGLVNSFGKEPVVCYDRTKVIDILAEDMPREEAEEFFDFNIAGAYLGEATPVFLEPTEKVIEYAGG